MTAPATPEVLLEVKDLRTYFHTRDGVAKAVDGLDLTVHKGEVVGLVGESGCGKSVTSLSIMRLIPHPGRIESGSVQFGGQNLLELSAKEMTKLRGDRISMIFQQPTSALNPVYQVGAQISEVFELHQDMDKEHGRERAIDLLRAVGIPEPGRRSKAYPHEMSGGMAQRVMIAMALALQPELLIADEPTTALDVTIQAQILDLMRELRRDLGTSIVLITHNLGVVAEMSDRIAVMYAGQIVEEAETNTLFQNPKHPYSRGLIGSVPVLGEHKEWLDVIPGRVPLLIDLPPGCRFAARCEARVEAGLEMCTERMPDLMEVEPGHSVRCWLYDGDAT